MSTTPPEPAGPTPPPYAAASPGYGGSPAPGSDPMQTSPDGGPGQPAAYPPAAYPPADSGQYPTPGYGPPGQYPNAGHGQPGGQPTTGYGHPTTGYGYPNAGYGAPPDYPSAGYALPPQQPWSMAAGRPLASWGQRVVGYLWDVLLSLPATLLMVLGYILMFAAVPSSRAGAARPVNSGLFAVGLGLLVVGAVASIALSLWSQVFRQGRTGQSWGKSKAGLRLLHQDTGQVIGPGNSFLRQLCHVVDGIAYVGYLFPLWDPMRQTFADKIMKTVVVVDR